MRLFFLFLLGICLSSPMPVWAKSKPRCLHTKSGHCRVVRKKTVVKKIHKKKKSGSIPTPTYVGSALGGQINGIINNSKAKNAAIAVYVKSMTQGDTLYMRNVNHPFIPASTLKIFTAEAALIYLGPEYRFSTQLLTDTKTIKDGVLQGNLYIILSGDPSLTFDDLEDLFLSLKTKQINAIAGNVYIDTTAYDQDFYGPGWDWKDRKYCYGAPISASIINHNCLSLGLSPSSTGQAARVLTSSQYFYPPIHNGVITQAKHKRSCSLRLSTGPGGSIDLIGCMPSGKYVWGLSYVVSNLSDYNRALFSGILNHLSIQVRGNINFAATPPNAYFISSHNSQPLSMIMNKMMKKSDNVIAGALFKKLGELYNKHPGSWSGGSAAVSRILATRAGIDTRGLRVLDGSGVSPGNLSTPAQMMQVLNFAYHQSTNDIFVSALPIAGIDGTLKNRMGNIARKVRAKTGTISGVISLAGYAITGDQEPLAFVIMINGSKGMAWRYRALEDKIATALTRYKR